MPLQKLLTKWQKVRLRSKLKQIQKMNLEDLQMISQRPLIIALFGSHLFMTVRTGFIQKYIFKAIKLSVTKDPDAEGDVSQFGALTAALSSTIGTANIIAVLLLSKVIADETKKYDGEHLNDKDTTEVPILANAKKRVLG